MIKAYIHPTETCPKCGLPVFFHPLACKHRDGGLKCWNPDCQMNREKHVNSLYQDIATDEIVQPGASEGAEWT